MTARLWISGIAPVVLAGALVAVLLAGGVPGVLSGTAPPPEEISFNRIALAPDLITLTVLNDGAGQVTVAQVLVNGAYRMFTGHPAGPIGRLRTARIEIPYPWIEGEMQHVRLVSGTGVTFDATVEVATASPPADVRYIGSLALLGFYIGVVPVFLGLLWLPFLKGLRGLWYSFFLAFTVGLLIFLGVDTVAEAIEVAAAASKSVGGIGLAALGFVAAYAGLSAANRKHEATGLALATAVALGIGVHNLGEGLAVGSAFAIGNVSLGTTLVVGFVIHNVTEGLAVVAPIARGKPRLGTLAALGLLAGSPAILGTWIGGYAYSPAWAALFLGIGAGAIFQVAAEIVRFMGRESDERLLAPANVAGLVCGLAVMWATGLLVAA